MAHHNRTPRSVLEAPKGTRVPIGVGTPGYLVDLSGTIYRTAPRRGRRARQRVLAAGSAR